MRRGMLVNAMGEKGGGEWVRNDRIGGFVCMCPRPCQLTSDSEAPEVAGVCQPHEDGKTRHGDVGKERLVARKLHLDFVDHPRLTLSLTASDHGYSATHRVVVLRQRLEHLERQIAFLLVELGDFLHHRHGCLVLASVHEELWRFVKAEGEEAQNENAHRDSADSEKRVAPTEVVAFTATVDAGRNSLA